MITTDATAKPNPEAEARFEHGLEVLHTLNGPAGTKVVSALQDIAPDLAHHMVAFGYGDVYAGPGLEPSQRQLVTLGILTALGGCEPQLEFHLKASLNIGVSTTEIIETITQSAVYCGFPKALNAIFTAKRVFSERGLLPIVSTTQD